MPPRKPRTPKDALFEHGRQLLQDAENSTDPELKKLRIEAARRYFKIHLISPGVALVVGLLVFSVLAASSIYSAYHASRAIFVSVSTVCVLFALVISLFLFALSGIMGDTLVAKVILGMFDKVLAKFWRAKTDTAE